MAKLILCFPSITCELLRKGLMRESIKVIMNCVKQLIVWWYWWTQVFILQFMHCTGALILPIYNYFLIYFDADYKPCYSKRNWSFRKKRDQKGSQILVIAGHLCVFSNVCNIYRKDLVLLQEPVLHHNNSVLNKSIQLWNVKQNKLGMVPPSGWPLSLTMFVLVATTTLIIVISGYIMILKRKISNRKTLNKPNVVSEAYQSVWRNGAKIKHNCLIQMQIQ